MSLTRWRDPVVLFGARGFPAGGESCRRWIEKGVRTAIRPATFVVRCRQCAEDPRQHDPVVLGGVASLIGSARRAGF